ncbi:MAG: alpha/beta hydrolase [Nevskia sp.]|nr:alpha/beta hydrolase [Nevskia sp.]
MTLDRIAKSLRAALPMLLFSALLAGCMPGPQGTVAQLFPKGPRPLEGTYSVGDRHIHYVEMPGAPQARILFVHGSPGGWEAWARFLGNPRLQAMATMISVDRPGFGGSDPGRVETDLGEQARLLEPLLRSAPGVPTIVVGHSLGGPVAARLAMDYPDEVAAAVLVAPAIDPDLERPLWYNRAMEHRPFRDLMPGVLVWSSDEIMRLSAELRGMRPRWKDLRMPVTVVQGDNDDEVDPRTADFAQRVLPPSIGRAVRVRRANHYLIWNKPAIVVDTIAEALSRTAPAAAMPRSAATVAMLQ